MNKLPTVDIKGKPYVQVKDRVMYFVETYPNGTITTEIVKNDDISVVVKATVHKDGNEANLFTTGHSEAYREGSMGNVPVEVAETSAVGRALGLMGIGIIESVASADEVNKSTYAPSKTPITEKQISFIKNLWTQKGVKPMSLDGKTSFEARGYIDRLMKLPTKMNSTEANGMPTPDDYMAMDEAEQDVLMEEVRAKNRARYADSKEDIPVINAE